MVTGTLGHVIKFFLMRTGGPGPLLNVTVPDNATSVTVTLTSGEGQSATSVLMFPQRNG